MILFSSCDVFPLNLTLNIAYAPVNHDRSNEPTFTPQLKLSVFSEVGKTIKNLMIGKYYEKFLKISEPIEVSCY
jgi:hypothetical protein